MKHQGSLQKYKGYWTKFLVKKKLFPVIFLKASLILNNYGIINCCQTKDKYGRLKVKHSKIIFPGLFSDCRWWAQSWPTLGSTTRYQCVYHSNRLFDIKLESPTSSLFLDGHKNSIIYARSSLLWIPKSWNFSKCWTSRTNSVQT